MAVDCYLYDINQPFVIVDEIRDKTINSILEKSEMELALNVLMGNLKMPG